MDKEEVKRIWRETDAVCFDVDSTVVREEGIDEFAKFCGKGDEVAELTRNAMKGTADFRDMLLKRLSIISPGKSQLEEYVKKCPHTLTPGVELLVRTLKTRNIPVYLVSGGFRQIIYPIARTLGIPEENIYANRILFENGNDIRKSAVWEWGVKDALERCFPVFPTILTRAEMLRYFAGGGGEGEHCNLGIGEGSVLEAGNYTYSGIDLNEPTSKQMGKAEVISRLKQKFGYEKLVIIGDGATDAEACPPANAFIGFGGNVARETVRNKTKWFVTDFHELIDELNKN